MRISTDKDDPGFCAWIPQPITILLDGVECRGATMADEETGEILRYLPDRDGNPFVVHPELDRYGCIPAGVGHDDEYIATETVRGKVEVILPDGVSRDPYHWVEPFSERVRRIWWRWRFRHSHLFIRVARGT